MIALASTMITIYQNRLSRITSDAGLLACRELDDALGLTETTNECLQESRGGRNVQHRLVGLLRQSVYSRLAGYEDTNDAERLAQDPTMRIIVGRRGGPERPAASTNTMSRFLLIPFSSGDRRTLSERKMSTERRAFQRFLLRCRNNWEASRSGEARRVSSLRWRRSIAEHLLPDWMCFLANGGIRAIEGS